MTYLLYDAAILAVLVICLAVGCHRGLLLSLCGLVVVVAAYVGAGVAADTLATPVSDFLQPKLAETIEDGITRHMANDTHAEEEAPLDALQDMGGLYAWAAEQLEDVQAEIGQAIADSVTAVAVAAAGAVAARLAHSILFVVAFAVLFLLLTLLLHALDFVAKLPGLHFCNALGGGIIGLAKGVLYIFVAVCLLQIFGKLLTDEVLEQTYLTHYFVEYNPILLLFR